MSSTFKSEVKGRRTRWLTDGGCGKMQRCVQLSCCGSPCSFGLRRILVPAASLSRHSHFLLSFLPVSFPFFYAHTHPLPSTDRHTTTCRCNNLSSPGMNVPGNINHTCTFCYIYYLITIHAFIFTFF